MACALLTVAAATALAQPAPLSSRERLARIVALEDARSLGDGWLRDQVLHPDPEVRRQAVLALGRIGRPETVEPLVAALVSDEAGAVRSTAAFALGIVEDPLPEEALGALEAATGEPSARVREKALEALGRKGADRQRQTILAQLGALVAPSGYSNRREDVEASRRRTAWDEARLGLFALARLGPGPDAVAVLEVMGGDVPRTNWWVAAWSAAELHEPALIGLHRAWSEATDPVVQALGVRGMGRVGVRADPSLADALGTEVALFLDHPDAGVRMEAIAALTALASAGRVIPDGVGPRLLAGLDEPDPELRRAALVALAAGDHSEAADALLDWTRDEDPGTRAAAFRALHRQDEDGFRLLMSGWSDPDPMGREAIAEQLGQVGDARVRDFLIHALLPDEDPRVRTAALEGVGRIEAALVRDGLEPDPETEAALAAHLTAADPFERASAARALGRLGVLGPEVRAAALADTDSAPWFRLAALRSLTARGGPEAAEAARAHLGDAAWPVRAEAHRFLRSIGEPLEAPPAPAMREDGLEEADYDSMLHPPFTPVAWIHTERGEIEIELYIADAPRTVWRFMRLARSGFYDGQRWSRPLPGLVLHAGEDRDAPRAFRSEINERTFMRGSVGMDDRGKDTGGSRFFITLLPAPERNGRRTLFGHVRRGFEVLERLQPGDRIERVRIWDGITPPDP